MDAEIASEFQNLIFRKTVKTPRRFFRGVGTDWRKRQQAKPPEAICFRRYFFSDCFDNWSQADTVAV